MARDPILALARSALGFRRLRPGQLTDNLADKLRRDMEAFCRIQ